MRRYGSRYRQCRDFTPICICKITIVMFGSIGSLMEYWRYMQYPSQINQVSAANVNTCGPFFFVDRYHIELKTLRCQRKDVLMPIVKIGMLIADNTFSATILSTIVQLKTINRHRLELVHLRVRVRRRKLEKSEERKKIVSFFRRRWKTGDASDDANWKSRTMYSV